jgi:hypothetical protein
MIRYRKRMPKRTPGDGLPPGIVGRPEVLQQLLGRTRLAPGVYADRRDAEERRRRSLGRVVRNALLRPLSARGRRRADRGVLEEHGLLLVATGLAVGLALALRWFRWLD